MLECSRRSQMKQRFAEFLQRTDGKQDMVDDFVSWCMLRMLRMSRMLVSE